MKPARASRLPLVLGLACLLLGGCSQASRLRSRCTSGNVDACVQLADMYATGNQVPRDLARAAEMYQHACDLGAAETCNTLGEIYERSHEMEGGQQRAEEMFRLACQGNSAAGCLNLGLALAARDDKKSAAALFERSCTAGWTAGCHYLAAALQQGEGVHVDVTRAIAIYEDACADQFVDSCLALGHMFISDEARRDVPRASRYYGMAIKTYNERCTAGSAADCRERDRLRVRLGLITASQ